MVADELRVERLQAPERLAVAAITGIAENLTLHREQTPADAHKAIAAQLARIHDTRRRLVLAHCASGYLGGEHPYQQATVDLLAEHGADLGLALRIAIYRSGLPNAGLGNAARRQRLIAMQSQAYPGE